MYDGTIWVYKNFLDDVKGQSYPDSGCEITFGIAETPARHASLIRKMYKCVVLRVVPKNELNGSKASHRGLPVLSDSRKKSPFADWSHQQSTFETLRPTLG